jgi:predicted glycoside hydrolase/deacetylase ChbG (UPF0249 family)
VQVVLNADDFGLSAESLATTIACFERGLLTSASIMVGMPATEAAIAYARSQEAWSFGVHLHLVGDGEERPLSDPAAIPGLVDAGGRLLPTNVVRLRGLTGRLPVPELELEIAAQIDYVSRQGIHVTHVDSHRHVHKLPAVQEALRRALPRFGVRRVRNVQDVYLRRPLKSPTFWLGGIWRRALERSFLTTDHLFMPTSAHDIGWHAALLARCSRLAGETLEVGVHPGPDGWRAQEQTALAAFVPAARAAGHELVSWREVGAA